MIEPYDGPANLAFDGRGNVLVTNHAPFTGGMLPSQFKILKVVVNDFGNPLVKPLLLP